MEDRTARRLLGTNRAIFLLVAAIFCLPFGGLSPTGLPIVKDANAAPPAARGKAKMTVRMQRAFFPDNRARISHSKGVFYLKVGVLGRRHALARKGKTSITLRGLHINIKTNSKKGVATLRIPKLQFSAQLRHKNGTGWQSTVSHQAEAQAAYWFSGSKNVFQWIPVLGRLSWFPKDPAKRLLRISPILTKRSERRIMANKAQADSRARYAENPSQEYFYFLEQASVVAEDSPVTIDGQRRSVEVKRELADKETRVFTLKSRWLDKVPLYLPFIQKRHRIGVDFSRNSQ